MLNPVQLKTFVALAQHRSFQGAAEALGIAQPTVSLHIQKLEEQVGVALFLRSRSGCQPTAHALRLLPFAERLLRLNALALRTLRDQTLRVGASSNIGIYLLPPLVRTFPAAAALDLTIDRNPVIAERLDDGELDVAMMEWWDGRPGYATRRWRREPVVVIVPPDHPWAGRASIGCAELGKTALLGGEPGTGTGKLLQQLFAAGDMPPISRQLGSTEAVKQAVKAGLGISLVMAATAAAEIAAGSLVAIALERPLHKELFLIWRECGGANASAPLVQHLLQA